MLFQSPLIIRIDRIVRYKFFMHAEIQYEKNGSNSYNRLEQKFIINLLYPVFAVYSFQPINKMDIFSLTVLDKGRAYMQMLNCNQKEDVSSQDNMTIWACI